jgi:hypothetical protein
MVSISPDYIVLAVSFYLLRLGGQGLMVHIALTATARTFAAAQAVFHWPPSRSQL